MFTGKNTRNVWIDQRTHIPVKTVQGDFVTELLNIQQGPQPASLFVVPPGYTKMDMGNMMQGMPHQQQ